MHICAFLKVVITSMKKLTLPYFWQNLQNKGDNVTVSFPLIENY